MHRRTREGLSRNLLFILGLSMPGCSTVTELGSDDGGSTSSASSSTAGSVLPSAGNPGSSSTSGAETGSESESSTTGPGCGGFLDNSCRPDVPPIEMCNVWDDDCPRGEKCTIWANDGGNAWNATRCVPLAPDPAGPGEPCTAEGSGVSGFDDCDVASVCLVLGSDPLEGECMPMCIGSPSAPTCEDPTRTCTIGGDSIPAFCIEACHPLDLESCPDGQGCYPTRTSTVCAPDASGAELGAAFDLCEFTNACDAGLVCLGAALVGACPEGVARCCTPWCDVTAPTCPEPTSCIPVHEPGDAPLGQEDVGLCGQDPQ